MKLTLFILTLLLAACQGTLEMEAFPEEEEVGVLAAPSATDSAPAVAPEEPADAPAPASTTPPETATTDEPAPIEEPSVEEPAEEVPEETLPEPGSIVEFTVAQGTGTGAWNTPENPVVVYVGQVLQITNLDDVDHQIHATSAAPIPHGNRLVPGQSQDYVVTSPLEVGSSAELWDHNHGRSAAFWVEAREYPEP